MPFLHVGPFPMHMRIPRETSALVILIWALSHEVYKHLPQIQNSIYSKSEKDRQNQKRAVSPFLIDLKVFVCVPMY